MNKLLIISRYSGNELSPYAGAKIHFHYLSRFHRDPNFEVKLVSFFDPGENLSGQYRAMGLDAHITNVNVLPKRVLFLLWHNWRNIFNYFGKTMGVENGYIRLVTLKKLNALKNQGYVPDCIILEWTQMALMIHAIKKIFPHSFYCAVEHDVAFAKYERLFKAAKGIGRIKELLRLKSLKKVELTALQTAQVIAVLSNKDRQLLVSNGLEPNKIVTIAPYYTDHRSLLYNKSNSNILFYGAMDRAENYKSMLWFIENVFKQVPLPLKLIIVGNKPHSSLIKFQSENIVITGHVPSIEPYLQNSFCMVAPLVLGAGIKIKVLEAMSAGIPVLTNAIGIEGIPAQDSVHYLHCETPQDYFDVFKRIQTGQINLQQISENAKRFVAKFYDFDKSFITYKQAILEGISINKKRRPIQE